MRPSRSISSLLPCTTRSPRLTRDSLREPPAPLTRQFESNPGLRSRRWYPLVHLPVLSPARVPKPPRCSAGVPASRECPRSPASSSGHRNGCLIGEHSRRRSGGVVVARFSEAEKAVIWEMREAGVPVKRIAKHLGRQNVSLRKFIADAGGKRPTPRERRRLRLSLAEREEISRGLAAGWSLRVIAAGLGRSPSTVCREVNANGGPCAYRALRADRAAQRRALRPRPAKLARCRRLRRVVERKLEATWSPEQISAWLASQYPERPGDAGVSRDHLPVVVRAGPGHVAPRAALPVCGQGGRCAARRRTPKAGSARASYATWS